MLGTVWKGKGLVQTELCWKRDSQPKRAREEEKTKGREVGMLSCYLLWLNAALTGLLKWETNM